MSFMTCMSLYKTKSFFFLAYRSALDGLSKIWKLMESDHHTEAHSILYVLPIETREIDELIDIGHTMVPMHTITCNPPMFN